MTQRKRCPPVEAAFFFSSPSCLHDENYFLLFSCLMFITTLLPASLGFESSTSFNEFFIIYHLPWVGCCAGNWVQSLTVQIKLSEPWSLVAEPGSRGFFSGPQMRPTPPPLSRFSIQPSGRQAPLAWCALDFWISTTFLKLGSCILYLMK